MHIIKFYYTTGQIQYHFNNVKYIRKKNKNIKILFV